VRPTRRLDRDRLVRWRRPLDALRADALAHATYRGIRRVDVGSRQSSDDLRRLRKMLARNVDAHVELLQNLGDLAERLAPQLEERGRTLAEVAPLLLRDGAAQPANRGPLASAPVRGVAMPGLQRAR
jgi:hypothetical protein